MIFFFFKFQFKIDILIIMEILTPKKQKYISFFFFLTQMMKLCSDYVTKLDLMVKLQFQGFEECGVLFIAISPRSTLTWSGYTF